VDTKLDSSKFPLLNELMRNPPPAVEAEKPQNTGWLAPGISAGIDNMQSSFGSYIQSVGDIARSPTIAQFGKDMAVRNDLEAAQNGRPDRESFRDLQSWSEVPSFVGYQVAKQVPQIGASLLAAWLGKKFVTPYMPEAAATVGAKVPGWLGGGGALVGDAAKKKGAEWAAAMAAQVPLNFPLAAGSMYSEADAAGNAGPGAALAANALAIPYSIMEGFQPAALESALAKGLTGNFLKRVGMSSAVGAATETVTEGVQTGMEQAFRTDLPLRDKLSNVVEGALTGGMVGGILGSFGGIRRLKTADPASVTNDDIGKIVDDATSDKMAQPPTPMQRDGAPMPPLRDNRPLGARTADGKNYAIPTEELMAGLAKAQQHQMDVQQGAQRNDFAAYFGTEQSPVTENPATTTIMERIKQELDLRDQEQQGIAPVEDPAVAADMMRTIAQGPMQGEVRTYEDTRNPAYEAPAPVAAEPAPVAPFASPASEPTFELFDPQGERLGEQQAPVSKNVEVPPDTKEIAARKTETSKLLGDNKSQWAKDIINAPTKDNVDVLSNALKTMDSYDARNVKPPSKLLEYLRAEKVVDDKGVRRNIPAELDAAAAKVDELQARARQLGTAQALAEAKKFQKEQYDPLLATATKLKEAAKRQSVTQQAPVGAEGIDADQLIGNKQSEGSTAYEAAQTLERAAPVWDAVLGKANDSAPLAKVKTENLLSELAAVQSRAITGTANTEWAQLFGEQPGVSMPRKTDVARTQQLQQELARRDAAAPAQAEKPVSGSRDMFGKRAPIDLSAEQLNPAQKYAASLTSSKTQGAASFVVDNLKYAEDEGTVVRTVANEIAKMQQAGKALPSFLRDMGQNIGLIDESGKVRDLNKELRDAQKKLANMWAAAKKAGGDGKQAQAYQRQTVQPLIDTAERINAALTLAPKPASDIRQGGVREMMLNPAEAAVAMPAQREGVTLERKLAMLGTIAKDNSPKVRHMHAAARDARAMVESFAPNATAAMDTLLAKYARITGGVMFSRVAADQQGPPLQRADFDKALTAIISKLPASARNIITVVETTNDLPSEVLVAAEQQGFPASEIHGVLYGGRVYVVRDKISSAEDLQEVINHEVFGHGGARALFGDQREAMLSTAFKLAGGVEGLRRIARAFGVEAQLNPYIPARELTDADKAALVDELLAQAAGVATGKFKTAVLSWVGTFKNALYNVLKAVGLDTLAERLNTFDAADLAVMMTNMRDAVERGNAIDGKGVAFKFSTPQGMNESAQNFMKTAENIKGWFADKAWPELSLKMNQFHLYTSTLGHIADFFGSAFQRGEKNALKDYASYVHDLSTVNHQIAHLVKISYAAYETLEQGFPKAAKAVGDLMGAAYYRIDPRKTWDAQPTLHANPSLKPIAEGYHKLYNDLRQNKAAAGVYDAFIETNEAVHFMQQAMVLYNLLATDGDVSQDVKTNLATRNPMDEFRNTESAFSNLRSARDFWKSKVDSLINFTDSYVKAQRGMLGLSNEETKGKINRSTSTLDAMVTDFRQQHTAMSQAPYFHLGRFGDYVVSFYIKADENDVVSPDKYSRIAEAFKAAGVDGIEIPPGSTRHNVFLRFESLSAMQEAARVARQLAKEGIVRDDGDNKIKAYTREHESEIDSLELQRRPQWASALVASIKSEHFGKYENLSEEQQKLVNSMNNEYERHVTQFLINLLPDTAQSKVMVHRNSVPGYSSDMIRSFLFRTNVAGRAIASLYASPKMASSMAGMFEVAKDARTDPDIKKGLVVQNIVSEVMKRDADRRMVVGNTFLDTVNAFNHAYFMGLAPSHFIVNLTQIPVTLWPELSKKFGFIPSAKAIAKVTPTALSIMKATLIEGRKLGWKNLPDASITREVLERSDLKLTKSQIEFVLKVVNNSLVDIGSQSREQGRIIEGSGDAKTEQVLRWTSATGYYSEMLSRLVAALASRELYGENTKGLMEYTHNTIRQSMFDYEQGNRARATGRMGLAGQYTPIMTSLMQYTFQLTEKLYREFHAAFVDGAKTRAEKAEARKFLGAHLAAVTTLAGTVGMPMANLFAMVFNNLRDLFPDDDDEPTDILASYKNFMTYIFGKDAANVIAHGVPRAFGMDISKRVGEQDLIPYLHMFSRVLLDKRAWQDKAGDGAIEALGAPVSMALKLMSGTERIMNGDVLGGMAQALPNALAGPAKAASLYIDGYVDTKGNKIPMTAGGSDMFWQAMGFNPDRRARYSEAKGVQASLNGAMFRKQRQLREDLVTALEEGNVDAARAALQAVKRWDARNPEFDILPTIGSVIGSRKREREQAEQSSTPLGVKPELADRTAFFGYD
jgi:hypothetical protein